MDTLSKPSASAAESHYPRACTVMTSLREAMTSWVGANKRFVHAVGVLVDSPVSSMAVAVGGMDSGGWITPYDDVDAFEAAIARAIQETIGAS